VEGSPIRQNPNIDRELMNNGFDNPLFVALQDLVAVYGAINFSNDLPNPYKRVEPWGTPPPGNNGEWGSSIGAQGGPDGFLYVLHRCESQGRCTDSKIPPVVKLNPRTGASVATMGVGMFSDPHGFHVDGQNNVWVTDTGWHIVRKFSPEGKLLMTIGTPQKEGAPHVGTAVPAANIFSPTDVVTAPNGDIFVTEGHDKMGPNSRVSKFTADGKFVKYLTKGAGSGPQQVSGPHAIQIDRQGRLFVGDRDNNRVLIWDQEGNFLDMWHQFSRPSGIWIDVDDTIYVADSESWGPDNLGWRKGLRIGSAVTGRVQYFIEDIESRDFDHSGAEGIGVDAFGNVYGTTNRRQSVERHEPPTPKPSRAATWGPATGAWPPSM
jgi:hypothetical protein